jgi:hypothetical protein
MRVIIFLPIGLIKQAQADNWLRSLAYFVRLKSLYKNNTHYNFTLRSLAGRMRCSPAALAHHLKILKSQDLIRYHDRNLTFCGLKKLQAQYGEKNIGIPVDRQNQLEVLRAQLIRLNLGNQAYRIHKAGIQKRSTRYIPWTKTERFSSCYVGLSCTGFGRIFGLSPSSGARIRKRLVRRGILDQTRVYSVIIAGVGEREFRRMKIEGGIPVFCKLVNGKVLVERRSELRYNKGNAGTSSVTIKK